ncbi:peptidase M30, partial [Brachyspira hampsonii]|nr:peptidase M30 [Brachyspira hampsonii]
YTWNLPTEKVFPNHPNSKYLFANYPSVSVFMNWLYQKNAQNPSVFQNIAKFSSDTDIDRVLKNVSFIGASSWDDLLFKWIEGINNGEVAGAEIKVQKENNNINLYPGALVVYNGSLTQSGNL